MQVKNEKMIREKINFIASNDYNAFTTTVLQSKGIDVDGKKIVKAGTILPANDATAVGILFEDVDVTSGDALGSLIEDGFVLKERLPEAPSQEAIASLKRITFK